MMLSNASDGRFILMNQQSLINGDWKLDEDLIPRTSLKIDNYGALESAKYIIRFINF